MKRRQRKHLTWAEFWFFVWIVTLLGIILPVPA